MTSIEQHYLATGNPPAGATNADIPAELADASEVRNLTPHDVVVFPADSPDRVAEVSAAAAWPEAILPTAGPPARIVATYHGAGPVLEVADGGVHGAVGIPTRRVSYGQIVDLPDPKPGVLLLVSLPVALAATGRTDLLVVDREVRSPTGTVVGCRGLARVYPPPQPPRQVRTDEAEGARLWADVDRCEHGRHHGDVCGSGCVGGISLGHPATRDGQPAVIAYSLDGAEWLAPAGGGHAVFVPRA